MYYVALESVEMNLQRVRTRFDAGGHAASERVLRSIHAALREIDAVIVFDNTAAPVVAKPTLRTISSRVTWRVQSVSPWLIRALRDTEFHLDA